MRPLLRPLRPPEVVFCLYFFYVAAVAAVHPVEGVFPRAAIVNLLVVGGYVALAAHDRETNRRFTAALRDWLPVPLIIHSDLQANGVVRAAVSH